MLAFLIALHLSLVWLSAILYVLIVGAVFVFIIKYRRDPGTQSKKTNLLKSLWESVFVAIPMLMLLGIFGWGYTIYKQRLTSPTDAVDVHIIARQCHWIVRYNSTRKITTDEIDVPVGKPVRLFITSEDMNYSFLIPNFQISQEIVPGLHSTLWFETRVAGQHPIYSSERCGPQNIKMLAMLFVLDPGQWNAWLSQK